MLESPGPLCLVFSHGGCDSRVEPIVFSHGGCNSHEGALTSVLVGCYLDIHCSLSALAFRVSGCRQQPLVFVTHQKSKKDGDTIDCLPYCLHLPFRLAYRHLDN